MYGSSMMYGWYMCRCTVVLFLFLDNAGSPSIVEQLSQKAGVVLFTVYCGSCLDLVLCLMPGL